MPWGPCGPCGPSGPLPQPASAIALTKRVISRIRAWPGTPGVVAWNPGSGTGPSPIPEYPGPMWFPMLTKAIPGIDPLRGSGHGFKILQHNSNAPAAVRFSTAQFFEHQSYGMGYRRWEFDWFCAAPHRGGSMSQPTATPDDEQDLFNGSNRAKDRRSARRQGKFTGKYRGALHDRRCVGAIYRDADELVRFELTAFNETSRQPNNSCLMQQDHAVRTSSRGTSRSLSARGTRSSIGRQQWPSSIALVSA